MVEEPLQLEVAVQAARGLLIVDCLTLWVSNLLGAGIDDDILAREEGAARAGGARSGTTIVISNEVGSGIVPGHRSAEPGHGRLLDRLGLRPLLELDLRLGEGTGALAAVPLVKVAAAAIVEVATFQEWGLA